MNNYLYLQMPEPERWEPSVPQQPTATESRVIVIELYAEETTDRDREV